MSALGWILIAVVLVIGGIGWYSASLATRLDRLHWRILSTREQLDRLALRRASQARQLVASGSLDSPAADVIEGAALACLADVDVLLVDDGLSRGAPAFRSAVSDPVATSRRNDDESALSQALRTHLGHSTRDRLAQEPRTRQLLDDLDMAAYRVTLARSMHNTDVTQVMQLRRKPLVRLLHLYGRAVAPQTIDFDDQIQPEAAS